MVLMGLLVVLPAACEQRQSGLKWLPYFLGGKTNEDCQFPTALVDSYPVRGLYV